MANLTSLPATLTGLEVTAGMWSWVLERLRTSYSGRETAVGHQYRYTGVRCSFPSGYRSGRSWLQISAVNLSDLSAMGADPAWLSLALTLPSVNEDWLQAFSDSLFDQLNYYGMQLIGGDTTRGPLSLTLTIHGFVPEGRALARAGARIGDWIYVTGTLGDSAAGLAILQNELRVDNETDRAALIHRHLRPQPRVLQGQALRMLASAAIDISDGLISDLQHILKASHCGARIELDMLPYSDALKIRLILSKLSAGH